MSRTRYMCRFTGTVLKDEVWVDPEAVVALSHQPERGLAGVTLMLKGGHAVKVDGDIDSVARILEFDGPSRG